MPVTVRLAVKGDATKVVEMRNEGHRNGFNAYTGTNRLLTKQDIERYDKSYADKKRTHFYFLAIDDSGRVVGLSGFDASERGRTRHRGEVGWIVRKSYARRGIATTLVRAVLREARRRGFKKIEAEAAVENVASVKLAKKCGFKIEGRKKAGLLLDDGRCVDTYMFGRVL